MEYDPIAGSVAKLTKPPGFGLIPTVVSHRRINLRCDPSIPEFRHCIEFVRATPFEYLTRWRLSNEVFGDEVELIQVIEWSDGSVSFAVTQPQYHGTPADDREIERFFREGGWASIPDPAREHELFFNYAFNVLAIDAVPRNCYVCDDRLLPFDVILCEPVEDLEKYLRLYPE